MDFFLEDSLILTSSARLARSLQLAHAQKKITEAYASWQTLSVQTLTIWLDTVSTNAVLCGEIDTKNAPQKRLSPLEERLLWEEVIAEHLKKAHQFSDLFDLTGLADVCIEANLYLLAWRLPVEKNPFTTAEETQQFLIWQQLFQARCKALNVLEGVRFFDWQLTCLEKNIEQNIAVFPKKIAFAGFDQSNPQEKRLREILKKQGCEVREYALGQALAGTAEHISLPEQTDELRAMVAWAKAKLEGTPASRIALVLPELAILRNKLADLLDDTFQPTLVRPTLVEVPRNYNISLGAPLADQPIVQLALHLLRLFCAYEVNQTDLSVAFLSPYWSAGITEADERALLEAAMREKLAQTTYWPQVMRWMTQQSEHLRIAQLLTHCQAGLDFLTQQKRSQLPSAWVNIFTDFLQIVAWPGQRAESSHEYQAKQAWQKALQQLARLDFLNRPLSARAACQLLQHICQAQVFQPETEGETAIQIMGMMEALSAPVDALWVMGMNDDTWPPPARPNPLLPAYVQRAASVANADSAVQMAFANTIHARFMHSAPEVIFSSSQKAGDKILRASPLMQNIPFSARQFPLANTLAETLVLQAKNQKNALQQVEDFMAPPVAEGEHVRGGTGLIRAQAICPAWAFYQFRLGAKKLKTPKNGLDAAERGQLVHYALEQFWRQKTHYRHFIDLKSMPEIALQAAIQQAANNAVTLYCAENGQTFSPLFFKLEEERLYKILAGWLAFELARETDFYMYACEVEKKVNIAGIEVTLKIDRIHALPEGGLELMDYKTGQIPKTKSWGEARITEPQLPIYAVFYADETMPVSGIQFGQVKVADYAMIGLGAAQFVDEVEKRKPEFIRDFADWESLKSHWKIAIENIVAEIRSGVAPVIFQQMNDLAYCEVLPLLRLPERQLQFERQLQSEERAS